MVLMVKTIVPVGSPSGQLNKLDWKKILIGAGVAAGGAILVYAEQLLTGNQLDLTPATVAFASIIINILRKLITNNS